MLIYNFLAILKIQIFSSPFFITLRRNCSIIFCQISKIEELGTNIKINIFLSSTYSGPKAYGIRSVCVNVCVCVFVFLDLVIYQLPIHWD